MEGDALFRRKDKGFTLIELLVVMLIVGIILSIAVPRLSGSDKEAIITAMKEDARNAMGLANSYYLAYRTYPTVTVDGSAGAACQNVPDPNGAQSQFDLCASEGNTIDVQAIADCSTVGGTAGVQGYSVTVTSATQPEQVLYNSCTDAAIRVQ